jgi:hypothetical protein
MVRQTYPLGEINDALASLEHGVGRGVVVF